jgi:hypothetical protein
MRGWEGSEGVEGGVEGGRTGAEGEERRARTGVDQLGFRLDTPAVHIVPFQSAYDHLGDARDEICATCLLRRFATPLALELSERLRQWRQLECVRARRLLGPAHVLSVALEGAAGHSCQHLRSKRILRLF